MADNAANPKKVSTVEELESRELEQEAKDLKAILATGEGRRFVWRLLTHCKVFGSVWSASASIHYLSGKQDVGHFIMGQVAATDQDALFLMMKENKIAQESRASLLESINQGATDV